MLSRRDTIRGSLLALGLCLARFFPPIPEKAKFDGLVAGEFVRVIGAFGWSKMDGLWRVASNERGSLVIERCPDSST